MIPPTSPQQDHNKTATRPSPQQDHNKTATRPACWSGHAKKLSKDLDQHYKKVYAILKVPKFWYCLGLPLRLS